MTPLEQELAKAIDLLRSGRSCWCVKAINPAYQEHTPTCKEVQKLMNRVRRD